MGDSRAVRLRILSVSPRKCSYSRTCDVTTVSRSDDYLAMRHCVSPEKLDKKNGFNEVQQPKTGS